MIDVPAAFSEPLIAREGEAGRAWIGALPGVIGACLERWALVSEGAMLHGHDGVVLPVRRAGGEPAMLKVGWQAGDTCAEAAALAAWDGRGAVRLLERDDRAGALLLERLDPARSARELDRADAAAVAGDLCRRLAAAAPPGLPTLADTAAAWADELPRDWERLGRPFDRRLLDAAVATCRELGPDRPDRLLHGNLRLDHVLRAEREPWLAIDPSGLAGDPAFEVAPLMGELCAGLLSRPEPRKAVRDRLAAFTACAGLDFERARRWAQASHVHEALWCRAHQPDIVPYVDGLAGLLT